MRKILVLGGSGLVGKALIRELDIDNEYDVYATYCSNIISSSEGRTFKLNIDEADSINNVLGAVKPEIVISCLRGDFNRQLDVHVKAAEYLRKYDGKMYFCSTTNVFDNDLSRPHYEDDIPGAISDYGCFKIECERRIMEILHDNASVLRLPQMLGRNSPRINNLRKALYEGGETEVYPELYINTNTDVMLGKQIHYIIRNDLNGIFHLAAEDTISYKDLYKSILAGWGYGSESLRENTDEKGYFALLSKRNSEFPVELRITNASVISYLADNYYIGNK